MLRTSGVARIWCEGGGTKLREEFLQDRQPHGVECRSLCGYEVTSKIEQLEVRGDVPQCPTAGDGNAQNFKTDEN